MYRVWCLAVFRRFLTLSTRNPEADTHVESHDDVLSDAGSTPAASTTHSAGYAPSLAVSAP